MIRAPIATSLSTKNRRFSNIFSKIRIVALGLGRERQRDRGEVGREGRPGAVVDLRDRVAEVVLDRAAAGPAARARRRPRSSTARPSRWNWRRIMTQVVGLDVADPQLAAGRGGERHEAARPRCGRGRSCARRRRACRGRGRSSRSSRSRRSAAPILTSRRARSWTCGSQAALRIVVVARGQRGGHQRVLGPHHRRLVHEDLAGAQAARRRVSSIQRSPSTRAPRSRKASRCGSSRRRPMKSPPGGGIARLAEAGQQRAGEQERGADRGRELLVERRCR